MKKFSRRALLTAAPLLTGAALIPQTIGGRVAYPRREPEIINFYTKARAPLDVSSNRLIDVMQSYVDDYLGPVWGVAAKLNWSNQAQPGVFNVVFVDSHQNDVAGALAYHEATNHSDTPPDALVDVEASLENDGTVGISVTHELAEMLVNPGVNNWASPDAWEDQVDANTPATNAQLYALEVCDPVESTNFKIEGVSVSNFVFPAYFEPWRDRGPVDFLGAISKPRQIADGGYQIVRDHEKVTQLTDDGPDGPDEPYRCWRFRKLWNHLRAQGYLVR